jgi:hypothetical protein
MGHIMEAFTTAIQTAVIQNTSNISHAKMMKLYINRRNGARGNLNEKRILKFFIAN